MRQNAGENKPPPKDPRIYLAAERTFLAWIRTSLSLMGFGFVVARFGLFLRELLLVQKIASHPSFRVSVWLGTLLVLVGVSVNGIAIFEHLQIIHDLSASDPATGYHPSSLAIGVALTLGLVGVFMAAYLVFVD